MDHIRRDPALDGLRGWAALVVCIFHFWPETFGTTLLPEIKSPAVDAIFDGQLAVLIFFVLSGYVLTSAGWRADKAGTRRAILRRYPRLLIPIAATTAIVLVLMATGLARHDEAFSLVGGRFLNGTAFDPSLESAIAFAFFWSFTGLSTTDNYHPFLWTMTYELIGSLVVLLACLAEQGGRRIYVFLIGASLLMLCLWSIAATFLIGALLSLLRKDDLLPDLGRLSLPVVIAAFVLNGLLPPSTFSRTIIATALVLAAASSGPVAAFLSMPVSRWLGRISFPLYLMQWPVMITVLAWLILATPDLTTEAAVGIALISLIVTLALAQLFEPVERMARRPERLAALLLRARPTPTATRDFQP